MEQQLQFEEPEKILSWREMCPGIYKYHSIENRGTNDYGRPISVITLETKEGVNAYYVPASLYWDLNRRSETRFIKYEGTQTSEKGYEYPNSRNKRKKQQICSEKRCNRFEFAAKKELKFNNKKKTFLLSIEKKVE